RMVASTIKISDKFESRKAFTILFVKWWSCSGMVGPPGRCCVDRYLDAFALAQSGQDFDILADRPPQSNGPFADCAIGCHADQVQLPYALHRLTRDAQNRFFVERNQNSPEHAAIHALGARSGDLDLEGSAAGIGRRHDLADRAQAPLVE